MLNVNGFISPVKRQIGRMDKNSWSHYILYKRLTVDPTNRLKVKEWEEILPKRNQKRSGVAILVSDKTAFKSKTITRDKEGHYILIKVSIQREDRTVINIYIPNDHQNIWSKNWQN